jgi:hypothetical protein
LKTIFCITALFLSFCFIGCTENEPSIEKPIETSATSFTGCKTDLKSEGNDFPALRLSGKPDGILLVQAINTEFCCGTDSISLKKTIADNEIGIEIVDEGPFTWCYCLHNIEFELETLKEEVYELTLIESEHAYSRDTFRVRFRYSPELDTTITNCLQNNTPGIRGIEYLETEFAGCNDMLKSETRQVSEENDTIIIRMHADTLKIFVGLTLECCIDFGAESQIIGDTLVMRINTLNDDVCDCWCYYTFEFLYSGYTGEGFYYQFFIDEYKRFEGFYNVPDRQSLIHASATNSTS